MKSDRNDLAADIRATRARYDRLAPGEQARLRRSKDALDVQLESSYWKLAGSLAHETKALAHVVALFHLAKQGSAARFSVGRYLKQNLPQAEEGAALRFRRLVQSRDRDELVHRLRALLRLAGQTGAAVDWGVLGADICFWGDRVRRTWAQDFYAPIARDSPSEPSNSSSS